MSLAGQFSFGNGTRTIYQSTLNDARRELVAKAQGVEDPSSIFQADNLADSIQGFDRAKRSNAANDNMAKFLMVLGEQAANRGVNKSIQSPAELQGLAPQNPQLFGLGRKDAIPYQKMVADGFNLKQVLSGFQEAAGVSGQLPTDAANVIANVQRKQSLISDAFNKQKRQSIYSGVPQSAAVNLFEIKLRNQRRDSLYALQ